MYDWQPDALHCSCCLLSVTSLLVPVLHVSEDHMKYLGCTPHKPNASDYADSVWENSCFCRQVFVWGSVELPKTD